MIRRRTRGTWRLALGVPLSVALLLASGAVSTAADPVVSAAGSSSAGYYWSPAQSQVQTGGQLTFRNASDTVEHGVTWTGGPETPSCSGVPIKEGKTSWSGSCSFAQAGTYTFRCYIHPTEMTGTITVSAPGTPPSGYPPPPGGYPEATTPTPGPTVVKVAPRQRGTVVRGSVRLSDGGAGSGLEVVLMAARSRLSGFGKGGKAQVGRLRRGSLSNGRSPFAVPLDGAARNALRDGGALPLSVEVTVTGADGTVTRRTRGVMMKAAPVAGKGSS